MKHPVARRQPMRTILRVLHWQLVASASSSRVMPFGMSSFLAVMRGMSGATGNIYYGLHEFHEMLLFLKIAKRDDLFLDVGSNIGSYTVLLANERSTQTISFEPNPSTFQSLKRNVELNGIQQRCDLRCCGVGAASGTLGFTDGLDTVNHIAFGEEAQINVPIVALDDLRLDHPSVLMKVDVEGFESFVVEGARRLLQSGAVKLLVMELNGSASGFGVEEGTIFQQLCAWGYRAFWFDGTTNLLQPLMEPTDTNTIFIHEKSLEEMKQRIAQAPPVNLLGMTW